MALTQRVARDKVCPLQHKHLAAVWLHLRLRGVFTGESFLGELEKKVRQQLKGRRVGFLLGAGTSFLSGTGYPLASQLWEVINAAVPEPFRSEIQKKLDAGADGIEQALDLLDDGGPVGCPHRVYVSDAIASAFTGLIVPTNRHGVFLQRLSKRQESVIHVFNLNYDLLIERAADDRKVHVVDGFRGFENAYFDPAAMQACIGTIERYQRSGPIFRGARGIIHHYKLHGSLGWHEGPECGVRRCADKVSIPNDSRRLMIPPQHRKVTDTLAFPYEALWSEFRRVLRHGPFLLNRLVAVGCGMQDSHVNAVLDNALARPDFTLIVLSMRLSDPAFDRWRACPNCIVVTRERSSLFTDVGPGHPDLWSFERLAQEV
jgi:hypothetical protein